MNEFFFSRFPDESFFQDPGVQEMMVDILFLYCKENVDISYRQGMHELLAPIFYVVSTASLDVKEVPLCEE
jgi:TBC1 domain family protein 5